MTTKSDTAPVNSADIAQSENHIKQAVLELRRTSGRYNTPTEKGEAMLASANAADMLERLLGKMQKLHELSGAALDDK